MIVQKFLSKYATAAHLALLAVAPLFLYPFCSADVIATVLLWLSFPVALWVLIEPSRRAHEMLHDARARVVQSIVRDPMFWILLALVVLTAVQGLNSGIALMYDPEQTAWSLREQPLPFLPGSVEGYGYPIFALSVALLVLITGTRHSLGKTARFSFYVFSSAFAAIAALVAMVAFFFENEAARRLSACSIVSPAYFGSVFGLYFLGGIVALVGAAENHWNKWMLPIAFAACGAGAGLYFFAPTPVILAYLAGGVLLLAVSCVYAAFALNGTAPLKILAVLFLACTIPVLCVMGFATDELNAVRLAIFEEGGVLFDENFLSVRETLSRISLKAWLAHPWLGSGVGAFPLAVRFNAEAADWSILPPGQAMALSGWWQLLAERGIVGALVLAIILGLFLVFFVHRLCASFRRSFFVPACALSLVALLVVIAETFVDVSFLRADVLLALGAFLALGSSSIPPPRKKSAYGNG